MLKVCEEEATNAVFIDLYQERERERERANLSTRTVSYNIVSQNIKRCHYKFNSYPGETMETASECTCSIEHARLKCILISHVFR